MVPGQGVLNKRNLHFKSWVDIRRERKSPSWVKLILLQTSQKPSPVQDSSPRTWSQIHPCCHIQCCLAEMRYKASQYTVVTWYIVGMEGLQEKPLCLVASTCEENMLVGLPHVLKTKWIVLLDTFMVMKEQPWITLVIPNNVLPT